MGPGRLHVSVLNARVATLLQDPKHKDIPPVSWKKNTGDSVGTQWNTTQQNPSSQPKLQISWWETRVVDFHYKSFQPEVGFSKDGGQRHLFQILTTSVPLKTHTIKLQKELHIKSMWYLQKHPKRVRCTGTVTHSVTLRSVYRRQSFSSSLDDPLCREPDETETNSGVYFIKDLIANHPLRESETM